MVEIDLCLVFKLLHLHRRRSEHKKTVKSISARSRCLGIHIRIGITRFPYDHPLGRFPKQTLAEFLELYR